MPTLVDSKMTALRAKGLSGSNNDMELAFWKGSGAPDSATLSDARSEVLQLHGHYGRDNWSNFLLAENYGPGSVTDMAISFWVAGGNLPVLP